LKLLLNSRIEVKQVNLFELKFNLSITLNNILQEICKIIANKFFIKIYNNNNIVVVNNNFIVAKSR